MLRCRRCPLPWIPSNQFRLVKQTLGKASLHTQLGQLLGTYRLHPHIYVNKHRHFQSFLDLLAGQLYILIANRQLNQIALSVHFQIYEVIDCIFYVLYIRILIRFKGRQPVLSILIFYYVVNIKSKNRKKPEDIQSEKNCWMGMKIEIIVGRANEKPRVDSPKSKKSPLLRFLTGQYYNCRYTRCKEFSIFALPRLESSRTLCSHPLS